MKYRYSTTDNKNFEWFKNDVSRSSLKRISLTQGEIRGLSNFSIDFTYPLSVIAGTNCSGKSTILALALCAYHNHRDGFKMPGRKFPYYTISDFFIQSPDEISPAGIKLWYHFLSNNWKKSRHLPSGVGEASQLRSKIKGGKWTKYSKRVKRNVVFFGIERVVPHSERSVSKSYKYSFVKGDADGYEEKLCELVGKILGNQYDQFWFAKHSKYRLPHVSSKNKIYSGFNMGAGENALFEIFSTIFACPPGVFLVIDEVELGLHESAQKRLIHELKQLCLKRCLQIICTTHSAAILNCVPPEARFFIERRGNTSIIISGVSAGYASGRLAEANTNELDLYVEDGISKNVLMNILRADLRRRVNIIPIGSANSIVRQLAARLKEKRDGECLGIFDGDQRSFLKEHESKFINWLKDRKETDNLTEWFNTTAQYFH